MDSRRSRLSPPAYDLGDKPQQFRIVFKGMSGYVCTALIALTLDDAFPLCDCLKVRFGLIRDAWIRLAGRSTADT